MFAVATFLQQLARTGPAAHVVSPCLQLSLAVGKLAPQAVPAGPVVLCTLILHHPAEFQTVMIATVLSYGAQ